MDVVVAGGQAVRAARARAGISQSELAERSGVPQPHISYIETGKVEPTGQTVRRLLDAAGVPPSALLDRNRQAVLDLAHKRGGHNVRVFGSLARGEDRLDSDIDLLMDFEPGTDVFDLARLQAELEELLGVRVDVVGDSKRTPSQTLDVVRQEAVSL